MSAISGPEAGPVAVTGASGFIGSHVVKDLVDAGYHVRACVRDASRADKMSYLHDINTRGPGGVELYSVDLLDSKNGAYDDVFTGCVVVFHVAADLGTDPKYGPPTPQMTYDALLEATAGVLDSCKKAGTVQRVVYTSSSAAVMGPGSPDRPTDHIYTEDDWAGGTYESLQDRYTSTNRKGEVFKNWNIERSSYAKGKLDSEKYAYKFGDESGIDVVSVCPCHVLGPLMGTPHNSVWQQRIGQFLEGGNGGFKGNGQDWNIIDVRDIAQAQCLLATSEIAKNGSRYMLVATDESGEPTTRELIDILSEMYPDIDVARDFHPEQTDTRLRARCTKAIKELGLKPHTVLETLRDTADSLLKLGVVTPAKKNN